MNVAFRSQNKVLTGASMNLNEIRSLSHRERAAKVHTKARRAGTTARLAERRNHYRVRTALPVSLENATGIMRDMSTTGAYLWINGMQSVGETIAFSIRFPASEGKTVWNCEGNVVRVEPREGDIGVAVRITSTTVELS